MRMWSVGTHSPELLPAAGAAPPKSEPVPAPTAGVPNNDAPPVLAPTPEAAPPVTWAERVIVEFHIYVIPNSDPDAAGAADAPKSGAGVAGAPPPKSPPPAAAGVAGVPNKLIEK